MDIRPPKKWHSDKVLYRQTVPSSRRNTVSDFQQRAEQTAKPTDLSRRVLPVKPQVHKPLPQRRRKPTRWIIGIVFALPVVLFCAAFAWYVWAIQPAGSDTAKRTFQVRSGDTRLMIARHLEEQKLIRSAVAFDLYGRFHAGSGTIKAGTFQLSPSQSVAAILQVLMQGQDETKNVFIPPGLTLKQLADPAIKGSFADQGYTQDQIRTAFTATYSSPLLKDKPAGATLEGYIFPETFQIKSTDSLESVLQRSFDELYKRLQRDGLLEKFAKKNITLHQALTLGSIVQEETSDAAMQPQVAQVFLLRLQNGMSLGSDVTFIYAARQLGVTATPELDSPYNTRIHTGLPPGPIATMNYSSLQAVASPAPGDYLFFVAGDDGKVYFSKTMSEHQRLIDQYCQKLCSATL